MEICEIRRLFGPNIWSSTEVLEATVRPEPLVESAGIEPLAERLDAALPERRELFGEFRPAAAGRPAADPADWARLLGELALTLQTVARPPATTFLAVLPGRSSGTLRIILQAHDPILAEACLREAAGILAAARADTIPELAALQNRLVTLADDACIGPSTMLIVNAAAARGIPWRRIGKDSLVQLGHGRGQHRIWTAETDGTSAIAEGISRNKQLTKQLLEAAGVPVPRGRVVATAGEAWQAAQDVGVPVVVKPLDGNHGRGVFLNLFTREEIEAAFPIAADEGRHVSTVVVEQFVPGIEHRLLVVGGNMVACAQGEHLHVTGDGLRTVAELIDIQINSDARRGSSESMPNKTVVLDATVLAQLAQEGVTPQTVPPEGRRVLVKQIGSHGADVTAQVHPEMAATAVRAARAVGLDIAGIDLIARDIAKSPWEQAARVCEVNAGPQLLIHSNPAEGPGQPVGEAIVGELFGPGETGRIPLAAILGTGATAAALLLSRMLVAAGSVPGLTCSAGKWVAGSRCCTDSLSDSEAARDLLMSPEIDAAVFELDCRSLVERGLPADRFDAVVLLPPFAADEATATRAPEDSQAVVEAMIRAVAAAGAIVVPEADRRLATRAAENGCDLITIAAETTSQHSRQHGSRVALRGPDIVIEDAGTSTPLLPVAQAVAAASSLCSADAGSGPASADRLVRAILAAVAAGIGLGLSPDAVRGGLQTDHSPAPR